MCPPSLGVYIRFMTTASAPRPPKFSVFMNGQFMVGRLTEEAANLAAHRYQLADASATIVIENEREAREAKAAQMRAVNAQIDADASARPVAPTEYHGHVVPARVREGWAGTTGADWRAAH